MESGGRLSIKISLVSLLSATYAIFFYLPIGFPIIGLEGARPISIAYFLALAYSLLFPFEYSVSAITLGGFIVSLIEFSPPFYILNFLPGTFLAIVSSIYLRKPIYAIMIYFLSILLYFVYPGGGPLYSYPLHVLPHLIILILVFILTLTLVRKYRYLKVIIASLAGSFTGQAIGTLLFLLMYYNISFNSSESIKPIWVATLYIYPVERIILTILGLILFLAIRRSIETFIGEARSIPLNEF